MPRHVPASVSELSRIGLLVSLPGERLLGLAERMSREDVASGTVIMREGEPGERFYVLLQGMVGVTQSHLGPRRLLRPGDYFGEVAAAMDIPRTATVTAITPCVVASCDRETFDEYIFPLFKEGQAADSAEDTAL
jgi:CRP-like cAMP-binding protein